MTLGERIKEYRRRAHLSQEKVAELVGVSRQAVTKWEADQSAPSTENLLKLAGILQISLDRLVENGEGAVQPHADPIGPSTAEQVYDLYKKDQDQKAAQRRAARKRNFCWGLLILCAYLLLFLLGRILCGEGENSSFLGWLLGWRSKYYLFGWLLSSRMYWIAMVISVVPAFFGKYRFSLVTLIAFFLGIFLGEWLGVYPPGIPYGHGHYGWAIWGGMFLAAIVAGILLEWLIASGRWAKWRRK